MKRLLRPRVVLTALAAVAVVILLFSFGDPQKILALMESFNPIYLMWLLILMAIYEVIRFFQWRLLLQNEGVQVPLQAQIFSFAGGEATRFVPVGNYFQNYLLTTAEGTDFTYTSAATTLIIVFEVAVSLTGLVILGLDGWTWLRPLIVLGVAGVALVAWLAYRLGGALHPPAWVTRDERLRSMIERAVHELREFKRGASEILGWRTASISYVLAAAYLVTGGSALYVVLRGLGVSNASFGEVLAVYFFSLAVGLIFPLPVDVGVTELSGVGAFLAIGVDRNAAISAMLINRFLSIVSSIVIAAAVAAILHDETRKALRQCRSNAQPRSARQGGGIPASEQQEKPGARQRQDRHRN